jgi:hypothetical protein
MTPLKIARVTNLSLKLVKEYLLLINEFSEQKAYSEAFQLIKERFGEKKRGKIPMKGQRSLHHKKSYSGI